jgi:hypothetical protein
MLSKTFRYLTYAVSAIHTGIAAVELAIPVLRKYDTGFRRA